MRPMRGLMQTPLTKNTSISEIVYSSSDIAYRDESYLVILKGTHLLRNTEIEAILFYLRNLNL